MKQLRILAMDLCANGNCLGHGHISPIRLFCIVLILSQQLNFSTPSIFGGGGPLYNSREHFVYSLNISTINQHIYSSDRAWLVEFYSSWCGHCVSFAPKWIQFAEDLKEWRTVVVIAAIDCADEANIPSCRSMEILGYPTLKLFPPHSPEQVTDADGNEKLNIGEVFKRSESLATMKTSLIEALEPMFQNLLGPSVSSTLNSSTSPSDVWKTTEFSGGPPFILLIYEDTTSFVGREVTLRLSRYNKTVRVLRFHHKNPMYEQLSLDSWPAAGYLVKEGYSGGSLVLGKDQALVELITTATIGLAQITKIQEKPEVETGPRPDPAPLQTILGEGEDRVSMEDLLQAIRYSLRNEVGLPQKLEGSQLVALKNYLGVLTEYFPPDRREVRLFLVKLLEWIRPQRQIENTKYLEKLTELEDEYKPWDIELNVWYDCRATVPGRRGYNCGLWRLFHVLTVIGYEKRKDVSVLTGIHGYVTEFLGCNECSTHFGEMVTRDEALDIVSIREQMLWLWKRHNEVNLRLKNSASEDPGYPKWYYPSIKHCPSCYTKQSEAEQPEFDESKVAEYLVRVYASPKRYLERSGGVNSGLNSAAQKLTSTAWLGGYFSLTDVGILMILYLSIALLLVFAYIHFKVARRRRFDPIFCLHRLCSRIFNFKRSRTHF